MVDVQKRLKKRIGVRVICSTLKKIIIFCFLLRQVYVYGHYHMGINSVLFTVTDLIWGQRHVHDAKSGIERREDSKLVR
jgi:hypothetical protein